MLPSLKAVPLKKMGVETPAKMVVGWMAILGGGDSGGSDGGWLGGGDSGNGGASGGRKSHVKAIGWMRILPQSPPPLTIICCAPLHDMLEYFGHEEHCSLTVQGSDKAPPEQVTSPAASNPPTYSCISERKWHRSPKSMVKLPSFAYDESHAHAFMSAA